MGLVPTSAAVGLPLIQAIEREAQLLKDSERLQEKSYARLAGMLVVCKMNEVWRDAKYPSFNAFMLSLSEKFGRSPQRLYAYIGVAEKLLPRIGEGGLDRMGIYKAEEVVKSARRAKKDIPQNIIDAALEDNATRSTIRALAHATFELTEAPKGQFIDIGGFYVDDEEHKTFVEFCKISMRVLNITPDMPQGLQRKKIIMFAAAEICGTYAAEVYGQIPEEAGGQPAAVSSVGKDNVHLGENGGE